mmetsp:Transcript_28391/g.57671  ORF Transcript_28391/g.57671 Transcript_28391/m.57671 type:complete len:224 (+) Transcript_28391:737-1408(+)
MSLYSTSKPFPCPLGFCRFLRHRWNWKPLIFTIGGILSTGVESREPSSTLSCNFGLLFPLGLKSSSSSEGVSDFAVDNLTLCLFELLLLLLLLLSESSSLPSLKVYCLATGALCSTSTSESLPLKPPWPTLASLSSSMMAGERRARVAVVCSQGQKRPNQIDSQNGHHTQHGGIQEYSEGLKQQFSKNEAGRVGLRGASSTRGQKAARGRAEASASTSSPPTK